MQHSKFKFSSNAKMSTKFFVPFVLAAVAAPISSQQPGMITFRLMQQMEQCTDPNQEYVSCGSACPITCNNQNRQPLPCMAICFKGCHCKNGYVKHDTTGQCILPIHCN